MKNRVLEFLKEIPKGKVVTYGQIAQMLGNKHYARAVGNILHNNPDGTQYPCYKVVNSKGMLSKSYAFGGAEKQKEKLEKDGVEVNGFKVDLKKYQYVIQNLKTSENKEG